MYPFDTRCGAVLCWVRVYCKSACCFFCDSHMKSYEQLKAPFSVQYFLKRIKQMFDFLPKI